MRRAGDRRAPAPASARGTIPSGARPRDRPAASADAAAGGGSRHLHRLLLDRRAENAVVAGRRRLPHPPDGHRHRRHHAGRHRRRVIRLRRLEPRHRAPREPGVRSAARAARPAPGRGAAAGRAGSPGHVRRRASAHVGRAPAARLLRRHGRLAPAALRRVGQPGRASDRRGRGATGNRPGAAPLSDSLSLLVADGVHGAARCRRETHAGGLRRRLLQGEPNGGRLRRTERPRSRRTEQIRLHQELRRRPARISRATCECGSRSSR